MQTVMATSLTILAILTPTIKKGIGVNPSPTEAWFLGIINGIALTTVWLCTILSWFEKEKE